MFNTKIYDTMDSSSIELLWEGEALFENNLKCNSGPACIVSGSHVASVGYH